MEHRQRPEQPASDRPVQDTPPLAGVWRRMFPSVASIRSKIIIPYFVLTLIVAGLGIFIVTRLIAGSFEERFTNQLLEAGRVAADGIVRQESSHLTALRPMALTEGIPQAIIDRDAEQIVSLIEVHAFNANLDSVMVLDGAGNLIVRLDAVRATNPQVIDRYQYSSGGSYAQMPIVSSVLAGIIDQRGDKYAGLADTPAGPVLYTSAPVYRVDVDTTDRDFAGVIVVGTSLNRILANLKSESLADITVYTAPDMMVASTLPGWQQPAEYASLLPGEDLYREAVESPELTPLTDLADITLFGRSYRAAYAPMTIRSNVVGVMGILLPSSFVVQAVGTSRDTFVLIFAGATVLTVLVGVVIARQIVRPVQELVMLTQAITHGDLTRRANIRTGDEVGLLAESFNQMTSRLQQYTNALEEENARTNAILDSIADGVIVRTLDGSVMQSNPAADRLLTDNEGHIDHSFLDTFAARRGPKAPTTTLEIGERTISVSAAEVVLPDRDVIGQVLVLRDITRETMDARTRDNFLNQIGHELRTPLTSLQAAAEVLYSYSERLSGEMRSRAAGLVFQQTRGLTEMINQIIDITAVQSSILNLKQVRVEISPMIIDTINEMRIEVAPTVLTYKPDPAQPTLFVEVDRRRLMNALSALIKNASQYSPEGSEITIQVRSGPKSVAIFVLDQGAGISVEDLPHIFDRFFRGNPVGRDGKPIDVRGLGQGLYIVKSVIEAHGGSVEVSTKAGEGST
ncbi:MAG: HAMP domain-containing protein, partial [Anaerolineae bacterium]|nr:HAMP domain-containing protein [Anaerolineae bacterium]